MLQKWFNSRNKKQKTLIRIVGYGLGVVLVPVGGLGLLMIILMLYLEFGKKK